VPVVVYCAPPGARDASAGVFVTMASDVAAMSPNTNIGAAHPVSFVGTPSTAEDQKVLNDSVAYIRSLAGSHGRNADWAEQAVTQSVSVPAEQALQLNVIEFVSPDINTLIGQLNGYQVTRFSGEKVNLETSGAVIKHIDMNWIESFLYVIADPNIAYVLLALAAVGIIAEFIHPALIFPGIIGAICGILAFYALGSLPVNLTGVLLIILAIGLFIAEIFVAGFGILFTGGIVAFIIGSLILFSGGGVSVNPIIIAVIVILFGGFFIFAIERIVKIHHKKATTGKEELIGATATARTALSPEGQVMFRGERWEAISESGNIEAETTVVITKIDGLTLYVKKADERGGVEGK
jgi:membrane-bound serine protease (ClpP class)